MFDLEFDKAPKELQQKLMTARSEMTRLRRAEVQVEAWQKELSLARSTYKAANDDFTELLNRWNPDTNEITPRLELAPAS